MKKEKNYKEKRLKNRRLTRDAFDKSYRKDERVIRKESYLVRNENCFGFGTFLAQPRVVKKVVDFYKQVASTPVPRKVKDISLAKNVTKSSR